MHGALHDTQVAQRGPGIAAAVRAVLISYFTRAASSHPRRSSHPGREPRRSRLALILVTRKRYATTSSLGGSSAALPCVRYLHQVTGGSHLKRRMPTGSLELRNRLGNLLPPAFAKASLESKIFPSLISKIILRLQLCGSLWRGRQTHFEPPG